MKKPILVLTGAVAFLLIATRQQICSHLGLGQFGTHNTALSPRQVPDEGAAAVQTSGPDTLYVWNDTAATVQPVAVVAASVSEDWSLNAGQTLATPPNGVVKLTWATMQAIQFKKKYYEEVGGEMLAPVFSDTLKRLDGRTVEVEGFVIPVDGKGKYVALSANPYASCFFCGKAGPASVMTIKFKKKGKDYDTDDYKHFRGRLQLNYNDVNEFYFVLHDSEEIK